MHILSLPPLRTSARSIGHAYVLLSLLAIPACNGQSGPASSSKPARTEVVGCGLQDRAGDLWFGTTGRGVLRVHDQALTWYTTKDGLCDDRVMAMLEDRDGTLWFGTQHGISRYAGGTFTAVPIPDGVRAPEPDTAATMTATPGWIVRIFQDRDGDLWFGTTGWGVYRYDGRSFSRLSTADGLCDDYIQDIHQDKDDHLWFISRGGGVCRYANGAFTTFRSRDIQNNHMITALEDRSGRLWFATVNGGARRFQGSWADLDTLDGAAFTTFSKADGLNSGNVSTIVQDRRGDLWFGTNDGVSRYDGTTFTHLTTREGLSNNSVWTIVEARNGDLWFGTRQGGLCRYDGRTFTRLLGAP